MHRRDFLRRTIRSAAAVAASSQLGLAVTAAQQESGQSSTPGQEGLRQPGGGRETTVERWIDTHIHLGDGGADQIADGLRDVFDQEPTPLQFVASCFRRATSDKKDPEGVLQANRLIHQVARRLPGRVHGACMVNPHFLDTSLKTMDLCFGKWGFVQLGEMLTYMMDYRMNTNPVEKLVRKAQQFDVPVQVHISTSNAKGQGGFVSGEAQLEDMLDLTERVPGVKYIIAHGIGAPAKDPPVIEAYLRVIERRYGRWPEHLWIEIKDFNATDAIAAALPHIPSRRLLAGTDWYNPKERPFPPYGTMFFGGRDGKPFAPNVKSLVRLLRQAGADETTIRRIAWQNAAEICKLAETSK